jgi:hypothetical protein
VVLSCWPAHAYLSVEGSRQVPVRFWCDYDMICTCRWQGLTWSVMSNYEECCKHNNARSVEAPMMRYIMERLAA